MEYIIVGNVGEFLVVVSYLSGYCWMVRFAICTSAQ